MRGCNRSLADAMKWFTLHCEDCGYSWSSTVNSLRCNECRSTNTLVFRSNALKKRHVSLTFERLEDKLSLSCVLSVGTTPPGVVVGPLPNSTLFNGVQSPPLLGTSNYVSQPDFLTTVGGPDLTAQPDPQAQPGSLDLPVDPGLT